MPVSDVVFTKPPVVGVGTTLTEYVCVARIALHKSLVGPPFGLLQTQVTLPPGVGNEQLGSVPAEQNPAVPGAQNVSDPYDVEPIGYVLLAVPQAPGIGPELMVIL